MNTYKYCCLNPDCEDHDFQLIKKKESQINQKEVCLSCRRPLKLMGEVIYGTLGGKYASATPVERKKMLLQRSKDHFKSSGLAERKHVMERNMQKDIIEKLRS